DLAPVLPELRGYPGHSQRGVHFLFGRAGEAPAALVEQPVLAELEPHLDRALPEGDIVLLGAGKVEQGRAVIRGGDRPQVDLEIPGDQDTGPGRSSDQNLASDWQTDERLHYLVGPFRRHEDVDVADGVFHPANTPGDVDALNE